jgi:transaldolase
VELYLDTGNVDEIRTAAETGLLSGVTTNPTLIAREGRDFRTVLKEIATILSKYSKTFTLSAEVHSLDAKGMVAEGVKYAKWHKNIIVKVPLTREGLIACRQLSQKKIKVNVTLCFSANQALLAAKSGAWCVSPFVGRVDDIGGTGMDLIEEIRTIYDNYNYATKILVASIRHPGHVKDAALIGADICTMPPGVFNKLATHSLTDSGVKQFMKDYHSYELELKPPKR